MASVDVNLDLMETLRAAVMQNSIAWVLCDMLSVMRQMVHEQNDFKWGSDLKYGSLSLNKRRQAIEKVEEALSLLEIELVAISVHRAKDYS